MRRALEILFAWHDFHREPATGFFGRRPVVGCDVPAARVRREHAQLPSLVRHRPSAARAGACRRLRAVAAGAIESACIDVDLVDLLVHGHDALEDRRDEIRRWLRGKLAALLGFQGDDGGFADELEGVRREDGWVRGYAEPQGLSNTFATWFRWIAIAMIADLLWPGAWEWRFRRMVGIGYRRRRA